MSFHSHVITREQDLANVLAVEVLQHKLIVWNDEVNTFDWVIQSLVEICDHRPEQAEQCAYLVHYKGKCAVKTGEYEELKPRCSRLLTLGLSAEIV